MSMSRRLALACVLGAVLLGPARGLAVPDPAHSRVTWGGPFNLSCTMPVICPQGDVHAYVDVTIRDQFGAPMAGIAANEIFAAGSCVLGGGSPCTTAIDVPAIAATDANGSTRICVRYAGGCCFDLQVLARGVLLQTLAYRSYDYNGDLIADLSDLGYLAGTYGRHPPDPLFNACLDFNCDSVTDLSDLGYFARHFLHACADASGTCPP